MYYDIVQTHGGVIMKKIALLTLSTAAVFALTGCGMLKNVMDELNKTPDQLPQTKEQARKSLTSFAERNDGYQFQYTFRYDEYEGEGRLGQKDGCYWEYIELDSGEKYGYVAIKLDDGSFDKYVYDMDQNGFVFKENRTRYKAQDIIDDFGDYKGEPEDSINAGVTGWLFFAHSQQLTKKDTDQILNRPVTNYEFTYGGIANQLGADTKFLIAVDDELCITMKIAISDGTSGGKVNMDMVALETGEQAHVPEVLDKPVDGGEQGQGE